MTVLFAAYWAVKVFHQDLTQGGKSVFEQGDTSEESLVLRGPEEIKSPYKNLSQCDPDIWCRQ